MGKEKPKFYFYFPKNENLRPILERNLGGIWPTAQEMLELRDFSRDVPLGKEIVEFIALRGEDIAKGIVERASPREVGITGSDFVLENVLNPSPLEPEKAFYRFKRGNGDYVELWEHEKGALVPALNLDKIVGTPVDDKGCPIMSLPAGYLIKFESEDKAVEMRVLEHNYTVPPRLCVLGPDNSNFDNLIEQVKKEGRPVRFVFEARLQRTARTFLEYERRKKPFDYEEMLVTGSTEGLVKRCEERMTLQKADVAIDIGQTFDTAKANKLIPYTEIMQTYPIEIRCYRIDTYGNPTETPVTLQDLKERVELEKDPESSIRKNVMRYIGLGHRVKAEQKQGSPTSSTT